MPLKFAFPPSIDAATRVLVLGSLPGDASIRQGEYYAHRGNAFWQLIGDVVGEDLRAQPYAMRLKRLRAQYKVPEQDPVRPARRRLRWVSNCLCTLA